MLLIGTRLFCVLYVIYSSNKQKTIRNYRWPRENLSWKCTLLLLSALTLYCLLSTASKAGPKAITITWHPKRLGKTAVLGKPEVLTLGRKQLPVKPSQHNLEVEFSLRKKDLVF